MSEPKCSCIGKRISGFFVQTASSALWTIFPPSTDIFPSGCLQGPAGMPRMFIAVLIGKGLRNLSSTHPATDCLIAETVTMSKKG